MERELTEDQKKKLTELRNEAAKTGRNINLRFISMLTTGVGGVVLANHFFVNSDTFIVAMTMTTTFLVMRHIFSVVKEEQAKISEKHQQILNEN